MLLLFSDASNPSNAVFGFELKNETLQKRISLFGDLATDTGG